MKYKSSYMRSRSRIYSQVISHRGGEKVCLLELFISIKYLNTLSVIDRSTEQKLEIYPEPTTIPADITNPECSPLEGTPRPVLKRSGLKDGCPGGLREHYSAGSSGAGLGAVPVERNEVLASCYAACDLNSSHNTRVENVSHVQRPRLLVVSRDSWARLNMNPKSRFNVTMFPNKNRLVSHMNRFFPRAQQNNKTFFSALSCYIYHPTKFLSSSNSGLNNLN